MVKSALNYSFGGNGYPQLFMTDCATAEINALKNTWSESKNLFCIFHVCQAVWRWCWDSKHQIPKEERVGLMRSFQKIVYADSKFSAKEAFVKAISSSFHDNWKKYLQGLWDNREKWCLAWRDITCHGHHTNNFSEITVRIFKDTVLSRVKAYNVIALLDFVCTTLEEYYSRRLREFSNYRNHNARLFLKSQINKANEINRENITQQEDHEYIVFHKDEVFNVNMKIGICSCNKGKFGKFCTHQCAVYLHSDTSSENFPPVTSSDRHNIALLADGDKAMPVEFFEPFILDKTSAANQNIKTTSTIIQNDFLIHNNDILHDSNSRNQNNILILYERETPNSSINNVLNLLTEIHQKYGSSSTGINRLETRLKQIKSQGNWESFLHTAGNQAVQLRKRTGAAIRVQPTTIARRSPCVTRGSKRIPSGRPAKNEPSAKKRKRRLGKNIKYNQPNAKSHGNGH